MFTVEQVERMRLAERTIEDTNCIGTVLYVLGAIERDSYVPCKRTFRDVVERTLGERVCEPTEGSILVVRASYDPYFIAHMGLVVGVRPLEVFHRSGRGEKVVPRVGLDRVLSYYTGSVSVEFYLPIELIF